MKALNLFNSKTRKELFRLYFTNPDQAYYLRQLEQTLDIPVSMIRKELMALEKEGLFVSHRMGNLLFYKLNKDYPIFHELKSIVFKTIGLEGTLKDALSKVQGIEQAFIYGSFAKGEEHSKSDVDLFMVGSIDENAVIKAIKLVERSTKREVNYTLYTRKEYKHKKRAKDSFIENVLENPIIMLKGKENELR